jgi:hypothetical protein
MNPNYFTSNVHNSVTTSIPFKTNGSTVNFTGTGRFASGYGINKGNFVWPTNTGSNVYTNDTNMTINNANNGLSLGMTWSWGWNITSSINSNNYVIFSMSNSAHIIEVAKSNADLIFAYKRSSNPINKIVGSNIIWSGNHGHMESDVKTSRLIFNAFAFVIDSVDKKMEIYKNGFLYTSSNLPIGQEIVNTASTVYGPGCVAMGKTAGALTSPISGITSNNPAEITVANVTITSNSWTSTNALSYSKNMFSSAIYNLYAQNNDLYMGCANVMRFVANTYNNTTNLNFWTWHSGHWSNSAVMTLTNTGNLTITGTATANGSVLTSDDRVKSDEIFIENATETLLKLRPQTYNKWSTMDYSNNSNATYIKESGLIAQEIFYDAPELRHLVTVPEGSDSNIYDYVPSSSNPQEDPIAYGLWGSNVAGVNYTGMIPYLIKAVQEKDDELKTLTETIKDMTARIQILEENVKMS